MKRQFAALWLFASALLTSASAQSPESRNAEPLMIQEQGSFAVGGKVITNAGTFNPNSRRPGARHCTVTTPTSSSRFR